MDHAAWHTSAGDSPSPTWTAGKIWEADWDTDEPSDHPHGEPSSPRRKPCATLPALAEEGVLAFAVVSEVPKDRARVPAKVAIEGTVTDMTLLASDQIRRIWPGSN